MNAGRFIFSLSLRDVGGKVRKSLISKRALVQGSYLKQLSATSQSPALWIYHTLTRFSAEDAQFCAAEAYFSRVNSSACIEGRAHFWAQHSVAMVSPIKGGNTSRIKLYVCALESRWKRGSVCPGPAWRRAGVTRYSNAIKHICRSK